MKRRNPSAIEAVAKSTAPSKVAASKRPSEAALAAARSMRRFDPKLTDETIETIARAIDENADAGASLNPKKKRLRNADEPVTIFVVPPR